MLKNNHLILILSLVVPTVFMVLAKSFSVLTPLYLLSFSLMWWFLYHINDNKIFRLGILYYSAILILNTLGVQYLFFGDIVIGNLITHNIILISFIPLLFFIRKIKNRLSEGLYPVFIISIFSFMELLNTNGYQSIFTHKVINFKGLVINPTLHSFLETFLVMTASLLGYRFITNKNKFFTSKSFYLYLIISLLSLAPIKFSAINKENNMVNLKVMLVQQNLGNDNVTKNTYLISEARMTSLIKKTEKVIKNQDIDILVFPENILLYPFNREESPRQKYILNKIKKLQKDNNIGLIIFGTQYMNKDSEYLSGALVLDGRDSVLIKKKYKVPFLERWAKNLVEKDMRIEDKMIKYKGLNILIPICYELYREELLGDKPDLIVNISNENIFKNSLINRATLNKAKEIAFKNSSYLLKVGSPGYTAVINEDGDVEDSLELGKNSFIIKNITVVKNHAFFFGY